MSKKLAELIEAGNFQSVSHLFDDGLDRRWRPGRGNRVRGKFVVVTMKTPLYTENDVLGYIATLRGRLESATLYELAAYAAIEGPKGWNGRKVMALGSKFDGSDAPVIEAVLGTGRFFEVEAPNASGMWRKPRSILCVRR